MELQTIYFGDICGGKTALPPTFLVLPLTAWTPLLPVQDSPRSSKHSNDQAVRLPVAPAQEEWSLSIRVRTGPLLVFQQSIMNTRQPCQKKMQESTVREGIKVVVSLVLMC
jgi:hypothetical protein